MWTEGVCGDGAAILKDGQPVPITDLLDFLNRAEATLNWYADSINHRPGPSVSGF